MPDAPDLSVQNHRQDRLSDLHGIEPGDLRREICISVNHESGVRLIGECTRLDAESPHAWLSATIQTNRTAWPNPLSGTSRSQSRQEHSEHRFRQDHSPSMPCNHCRRTFAMLSHRSEPTCRLSTITKTLEADKKPHSEGDLFETFRFAEPVVRQPLSSSFALSCDK